MSKEMNKLLRQMVKYDLKNGVLISLLIVLLFSFSSAMIYFIGLSVSLINFVCSVYATDKFLGEKSNGSVVVLITITRILLILVVAVPFINDIKKISFYMTGFISHFLILVISCIINRKGSV